MADAELQSRYKWQTRSTTSIPTEDITIRENRNGRLELSGDVPFAGEVLVIDAPGSTNVKIEIDPKVKKTTYAGLVFTTPCVVGISKDTTVTVDHEGFTLKDTKGKQWKSREVTLDGAHTIAFFPVK